jgi:hypothetical protein
VRLEATVAADTVAAVRGLDNLDADVILAAFGSTSHQVSKGAVCAVSPPNVAVPVIALIEHAAIQTALAATVLWLALATGHVLEKI